MTTDTILDFATIRQLAEPTLRTLPDDEVASAVKWLYENVMQQPDTAAQLVLFQSWVYVYCRQQHDMMFES